MRRFISIESMILIIVCLLDMISTLILTTRGLASEQNPIMAVCLRHSAMSFAVAKIASFLPFVVVTEWYRRHNPHFARQATRAAIVVYVVTYVVITAGVNIA